MLGISMPGFGEMVLLLVIVFIFFGAGKLPDVFAQAGKGIRAFKDASEGRDTEFTRADSPARKRKQIVADPDDLDEEPDAEASPKRKAPARDEA